MTLAFNNSTKLNQPADPISLSIIKVTNSLYKGEIKMVESDNVFDEQTDVAAQRRLRGSWRKIMFSNGNEPGLNDDGSAPALTSTNWQSIARDRQLGDGALDITLSSTGLRR